VKSFSKSGCEAVSEYLLDTSYLIDLIYADDDAVSLHEEIGGQAVTATVCVYELAKFVESDLDVLFETREVLPFSRSDAAAAGAVYRELHDTGDLLGEMDTVISGIARNRGLTLVTRDDDFGRVAGLDVQYY
jgi:predicted nucleic acid-binding protein